MQGSIFEHQMSQDQSRFALQNGKMLKVRFDGSKDVLARQGAMVAYKGMVEFDYEMRNWAQQNQMRGTQEGLALMRCKGQGDAWFANFAADIHIVNLQNDGLSVDGRNVLAFDSGMQWEVVKVQSGQNITGAGAYNVVIHGTGSIALTTQGHPLMLQVTPQNYCFADADAVVAWTTDLRTSMQAAVTQSSMTQLRGETGESWQMQFQGTGFVIVQPSEMAPPYQSALAGVGGMAQHFGVGAGGFNR
jgi:uncharacterized protein (AIM24 family)